MRMNGLLRVSKPVPGLLVLPLPALGQPCRLLVPMLNEAIYALCAAPLPPGLRVA